MRPIEGKQAQDIPLVLKEHHDGVLCEKHNLQLSKILKKRKARDEEEASHVVEPAKMVQVSQESASVNDFVPESQEEEPRITLAVSRDVLKAPRGRPLQYLPEERFKFAAAAVKGVSLGQVGEVHKLFTIKDLKDWDTTSSTSRHTVVQCLQELYHCYLYELARQMPTSIDLLVMLDASSDNHREFLGLYYGGKNEEVWKMSGGVVEINGHTAINQVSILKSRLAALRMLQREKGWKETKLYHVTSFTCDNTGSNTGENGVRGVLQREREREWEADGKPGGELQPLVQKGCDDHIAHLASREFDGRLMMRAKSWNMPDMIHKGDGATPQHVSSFAIIRVMGRIRSQLFHRPFKAFVRANGGSPPRIPVYSEIRYGMLDHLCLTFCQHQGFILLFLFQCRPLLTQLDLNALKILLNAECLHVVRVRALLSAHLLLPMMKRANNITDVDEYRTFMSDITKKVEAIAATPSLLGDLVIQPKDLCVQENLRAITGDIQVACNAESSVAEDEIFTETQVSRLVDVTVRDEDEEEEVEDGEIEDGEIIEIEEVMMAGTVLDLKAPSSSPSPKPALEIRQMTFIKDAACAFLFQVKKHGACLANTSLKTFSPTTRLLERGFSLVKITLAKNPETRIAVAEPLLALHDLTTDRLLSLWTSYYSIDVTKRASRTIASNPTTAQVDQVHYKRLMEKAREAGKIQQKNEKEQTLTSALVNANLLKPGERFTMKRLLENMPDDQKKRIKADNGGKITKKVIEATFLPHSSRLLA